MHYHVLRTDTTVSGPLTQKTHDVGVAPSYRAGDCVIQQDRKKLAEPAARRFRGGVVATWSRFSCDNQAHEGWL